MSHEDWVLMEYCFIPMGIVPTIALMKFFSKPLDFDPKFRYDPQEMALGLDLLVSAIAAFCLVWVMIVDGKYHLSNPGISMLSTLILFVLCLCGAVAGVRLAGWKRPVEHHPQLNWFGIVIPLALGVFAFWLLAAVLGIDKRPLWLGLTGGPG